MAVYKKPVEHWKIVNKNGGHKIGVQNLKECRFEA